MLTDAIKRGARVVKISEARSTGAHIALIDNRNGKWCDGGAPWELQCLNHGGSLGSHSRAHALSWMAAPEEWCEACQGRPA
jgi:hypothetical protein